MVDIKPYTLLINKIDKKITIYIYYKNEEYGKMYMWLLQKNKKIVVCMEDLSNDKFNY